MKNIKAIRIISALIAVALIALCISACGNEKTEKKEFGKFNKVSDMLFEVTFDDFSAEIPDGSVTSEMTGDMACSSVRNGGFVGRNFDYFMNSCPTFVVRTTAKEDRYATIGVGRLSNITSKTVEEGLPKEKVDLLPWFVLDGINEKGLVVNSNVVFKADWGEVPHTGTNPDAPDLNDQILARPLLDNCATADEAIEYLKKYNITPMNSKLMDLHYMISDPEKTYVVEFYNNEILVKEQKIMTNYFINIDKIPEHPDGYERLQILNDNYDEGATMEGMYKLMQRAKYTNLYDASNKWYSEVNMLDNQTLKPKDGADEQLQDTQESYKKELEYIKENGLREKTEWWDTTHNSTYDINNRKLWVTVHERYEEKPYEFSIE
ncbi:MAG: linear amide C-N hydrolase [Oscillospiraceae bacterium]|nr:linear amide C-N hydrolase [Candidatus Ruminococcus equi]